MSKELAIYIETERCKEIIKNRLNNITPHCLNQRTIETSNKIFKRAFDNARKEAFDSIKSIVKPYVIYRINKNWEYLL